MSNTNFLGACLGVVLEERRLNDKHLCVKIVVEDDGEWFEKTRFSSHWIDELITALQDAKRYMETSCEKEADGYGYKRKEQVNDS